MISRVIEDLLCGALGYGVGRNCNRELSQEEYEEAVKFWLRHADLDTVISAWIADGDHEITKSSIIDALQDKIRQIEYSMEED